LRNQIFWGDKRYYSLDYYLKKQFGRKIYKLALNGGMTCPNRDGTLGTRGCIFCSAGGSGDFSASPFLSITDQIEEAKKMILRKIPQQPDSLHFSGDMGKYIAYFQAYTNTYGDLKYLRQIFMEAVMNPEIVALSIATRPDCLGDDVLSLLAELNQIKPVWVELGLQTCHEATAVYIRRGYTLSCFEKAINQLNQLRLSIIVHVIIGLPGEDNEDIMETISYVSTFPVQGIKLQLLHILKDTDLADYSFHVLTLEEYVDLIISCLEIIPKDIVIHRITGDGPKELMIAPMWSCNKKLVLNRINQELKRRDTWQGKYVMN
jgi:radical SAM protein (TIGR01212 family)